MKPAAPVWGACGFHSGFGLGLAPDGDVPLAIGGEGAAVPVGDALLRLQAGKLGHQITFGGPDVAEPAEGIACGAVSLAPVVMRRPLLGRHVIGVEADMAI